MAGNTGPSLVIDKLLLALDPANNRSYTGEGTTYIDLAETKTDITLINNPTFDVNNGGSFEFNGVDNYIDTFYDLSWDNGNDVSIAFWIKPSTLSDYRPFLGKGTNSYEWQFMQNGSQLRFVYWTQGGGHTNGPIAYIDNVFTDLSWINIAMAWSSTENRMRFYRNGILIATYDWTDASLNRETAESVRIGGNIYQWNMGAGVRYWPGNISAIHFYSKTLSDNEVLQNYNALKQRFI